MKILVTAGLVAMSSVVMLSPSVAQAAQPSDCLSGKANTFFQFTYNDGITDSGCADGNTVTPADNPGQVAPELHVSCSDNFDDNGVPGRPKKSDLGRTADGSERLVVSYLIIKDVDKDKPKTCGDATPIPGGGNAGLMIVGFGAAGVLGLALRRRRSVDAAFG